ncbi:uncharacterized protein LOC133496445 isoform X2 [Syngnathoides biaculeatus]|nr:uncharacterized protein LOC133496445 isoform X2 [Syngnathoides biaculeatus]XP_061668039.1 uncharacterized protein LOC133496445 isoform X2 [Syngnathoides biaculeatus]
MEEDSKVEPEPVAGTSTEWTSSTEWTLPEWTSAAEAEPDNSQVDDSPETFEVTAQGLKDLMKSMEKMFSDVEELRSQCSDQAKELLEAAVDLKQQQDELKESYKELAAEMEEIMEALDDICITKSASEAREKEAEKLNKQF